MQKVEMLIVNQEELELYYSDELEECEELEIIKAFDGFFCIEHETDMQGNKTGNIQVDTMEGKQTIRQGQDIAISLDGSIWCIVGEPLIEYFTDFNK